MWILDIAYRYHVDGQEYKGDRLCFGGREVAGLARPDVEKEYDVGRKPDVHCDPDDPARAVLETDFHLLDTLPLPLLSVSFTLASLATAPVRRLLARPFRRRTPERA